MSTRACTNTLIRHRYEVRHRGLPRDDDEDRLERDMHAGAYPPPEAERECEVLQLRVRRLEETFRAEGLGVGEKRRVLRDGAGRMKQRRSVKHAPHKAPPCRDAGHVLEISVDCGAFGEVVTVVTVVLCQCMGKACWCDWSPSLWHRV